MSTLRWGVLGTARIGTRKVISAIQAADGCEVVAISSREPNRALFAARQLGIPRSYGSYRALLADPEVDAIYNPLPNHLHLEWTVEAVEAGKHVLCEKPIGLSSEEARRMDRSAAAAGVTLMEAFMYRLHPSWVGARQVVASGGLGDLRAVQSWFSFFNDDPADIRNVAAYGGGALMDVGCYCVNLSRMLLGGEPSGVSAVMTRDPASGVDTLTSAILEFGDRVAAFTCSIRAEPEQWVHVSGTEGRLSIEVPFNIPSDRPTRVLLYRGGGLPPAEPAEVLTFEPADPYTLQAEAFARAVLDGDPLPVPMSDSIANMEVIERLVAAAG